MKTLQLIASFGILLSSSALGAPQSARTDPPPVPEWAGAAAFAGSTLFAVLLVVLTIMWILVPIMIYMQLLVLRGIRRELLRQNGLLYPQPLPAPAPPAPTAPPAPVHVSCPTCQLAFPAVPGRKTACPRCGEKVRVEPAA